MKPREETFMTKARALETAYAQLAIDFNTTPEALRAGGLIFTPPALKDRKSVV